MPRALSLTTAPLSCIGRTTPSIACVVTPGAKGGFHRLFFGSEEIAVPVRGRWVHSRLVAARRCPQPPAPLPSPLGTEGCDDDPRARRLRLQRDVDRPSPYPLQHRGGRTGVSPGGCVCQLCLAAQRGGLLLRGSAAALHPHHRGHCRGRAGAGEPPTPRAAPPGRTGGCLHSHHAERLPCLRSRTPRGSSPTP